MTHNKHCGCDACSTGPIDHNHPEKPAKKNSRKGSASTSNYWRYFDKWKLKKWLNKIIFYS